MKNLLFVLFTLLIGTESQAQKILSEGMILFDVSVQTGSAKPQMADMFDGATASTMMKGTFTRSDLTSALGKSVTIFDHKAGNGVVLGEYGGQKILVRMNRDNWTDRNKKYEGVTYKNTGESKQIAGYLCQKAEGTMADGTVFTVFYAQDLKAQNDEYDPQFSKLPGIALEYESAVGNIKVKMTAVKVSFDPVPFQRFEIPTSGYRELSYEESKSKSKM